MTPPPASPPAFTSLLCGRRSIREVFTSLLLARECARRREAARRHKVESGVAAIASTLRTSTPLLCCVGVGDGGSAVS